MGFGKNIPPRSDKSFTGKWQGQYTWKIFTVFLHPEGRLTENGFSGYWIMHRVD
jgi:hypothetical protein